MLSSFSRKGLKGVILGEPEINSKSPLFFLKAFSHTYFFPSYKEICFFLHKPRMSFSGKKKKQLLQAKRQEKREAEIRDKVDATRLDTPAPQRRKAAIRTVLQKEDDEKIALAIKDSTRPLELRAAAIEGKLGEWPLNLQTSLSMPVRPAWKYTDTIEELDARETAYFSEWDKLTQVQLQLQMAGAGVVSPNGTVSDPGQASAVFPFPRVQGGHVQSHSLHLRSE